jgi:hypothetical protein
MGDYINSSSPPWSSYSSNIKTLVIQQGVTTIGDGAFYNCRDLTSVTIGNSVTTIGTDAFSGCSGLTSVTIGNSVTTIGDDAFYYCSGLTSVTIPNSVTSIGDYAFYYCSGLTSVTIGNSVTSIRSSAFYGCSGLTSITVDGSNTAYSSNNGVLFNKNQTTLIRCPEGKTGSYTIPNSVDTIGEGAFSYCYSLTSVTIPNSVTTIGDYAFYYCSGLTSVTIPNSVTTIGDDAFYNCSGITSVTIPSSVTSIGFSAFSGCIGLTSVSIPNSVTTIGSSAFYGCIGLTSVTISNSVTTIGNSAFFGCSGLTSVTIPNSVTTIRNSAFFGCSGLTGTLTIPNSVTTIGGLAFSSCSGLTGTLTIPNSVTTIGGGAFSSCSGLTSVTIGNSVTTIGGVAFYGCSGLTSVTIPNSVISIGGGAFSGCSGLTSVTIPNSVTTIGDDAFYNCSGLTEMYVNAVNPPLLGNNVFYNVPTTIPVHVLIEHAPVYQSASEWNNFSNIIADIASGTTGSCIWTVTGTSPNYSLTISGSGAMGNYTSYSNIPWYFYRNKITNLVIQQGVTTIGNFAFYDCFGLTGTLTIHDTVISIGDSAFYGCSNLDTVHFNAINCNSIGSSWLSNCPLFTTLIIGDSVQKIIDNAFASTSITEIYSNAVTPPQIYANTFYNVPNTVPVYVPCGAAGNYMNASFWNNFRNIQEKGTFNITLNSNNPLMGSARLVQAPCQTNVAIIDAVANNGYRFVQWNDGNNQNPRTVTVTQDISFVAVFAIASSNTYHVTVTANNPAMGTVSGSGDYAANATATITATANNGYRFVQWNDGNNQNPRTITVTQDISFIAVFAIASSNTYHVTVTANNPAMGTVTGSGDYAANTNVTITATANNGYRFVQWNDGNTQNPRTVTVTQDISFVAVFAIASSNTYHVTVLSNDRTKGSVLGGGDYALNTTISIGAIASQGYRFTQWDDGNTDNPRTVTVTQDTSFIATFESETGVVDIKTSSVSVYPKPANDHITVILPENVSNAVFTVYDMQGKALIEENISNRDEVSVRNLAAGIYIYQIRTAKERYTGKTTISK